MTRRILLARASVLAAAIAVIACNGGIIDNWGYTHVYARGTVLNLHGLPVANVDVKVSAFPKDSSGSCPDQQNEMAELVTRTDASGRYGGELRAMGHGMPSDACLLAVMDPHTGLVVAMPGAARFVQQELRPDTATFDFTVE